jgi:PAS domain S-box-containing protein
VKKVVLVVEDNPITRKMIAYTLASEGYEVLEAGTGQAALALTERIPDLLLLDYVLPDTDGVQLLATLRAMPGWAGLPAAIITGMVSHLEELRAHVHGPTTFLPKPIETERLVDFVRSRLEDRPSSVGAGKRVLIVDDDLMGRKLAALSLTAVGFRVEIAESGAEALTMARATPPDAVLSDVLMPGMDGFLLCRAIRNDPALAGVPVVLLSSAYVDLPDQELANQMGANALLPRAGDLDAAILALTEAIRAGAPVQTAAGDLSPLHVDRVRAQLERQMARNEILLRQSAIQAAALSVIRGLSEALSHQADLPSMLADVLVHCLDAAGLSSGVLYLALPDGDLRLQAQSGLLGAARDDAAGCFGHPELLHRVMMSAHPAPFSVGDPDAPREVHDFLARLGQRRALIVPFVVRGEYLGALILASESHDLSSASWMGFAESLAKQFGQTIAVGQHLSKGVGTEVRYQALMVGAYDAILILDREFRVIEANPAAALLFGCPRPGDLEGVNYFDLVAPEEREVAASKNSLLAERQVIRVQRKMRRFDGASLIVDLSASLIRFGEEEATICVLRDVTERLRAEEALRVSEASFRRSEGLLRMAGRLARIGAWALDLPDQKLTWSDEVRVIHEVPPDYVPNLEEGINFYAPEHRPAIAEVVRRCMIDATPWDLELQIITARGRRVWVRAIGEAERGPDGTIHRLRGAFQDISTSKRTEQALRKGAIALQKSVRERGALLKEVHHRVKNNLQVITSLLRLEAGRIQEAGLRRPFKDMQNRIMTMAALQEALYRSGSLTEIDIGPYFDQVVVQLQRSIMGGVGAVVITRDLAATLVSLDQGVPCGLIICELVANALRHGFPDGRSGEVHVTLRYAAETQILLRVSDNGVGLPPDFAARRRDSLGLNLVSDLARQLGGQLTIGPGPEAVFEVLFAPERPRTILESGAG